MSVFKRLSNVAKGKIKEIGRNLGEIDPFGDGDDPEVDPPKPPPGQRARPTEDKVAILDRLKSEGLLTEEEYAAKRALLDESASDEDDAPSPRKPMKRNL